MDDNKDIVRYVNYEAYVRYIIWRVCFYEDNSKFYPKYSCPIHRIFSEYYKIANEFSLAVDNISHNNMQKIMHEFHAQNHAVVSKYMVTSSTKTSEDSLHEFETICTINHDWGVKYEMLLMNSIKKGFQEYIISDTMVKKRNKSSFNEEPNEDECADYKIDVYNQMKEQDGKKGKRIRNKSIEFDPGENPYRHNKLKKPFFRDRRGYLSDKNKMEMETKEQIETENYLKLLKQRYEKYNKKIIYPSEIIKKGDKLKHEDITSESDTYTKTSSEKIKEERLLVDSFTLRVPEIISPESYTNKKNDEVNDSFVIQSTINTVVISKIIAKIHAQLENNDIISEIHKNCIDIFKTENIL